MTDSDPPQLEVSAEHTAGALADGSAQVVDVREAYERVAGHIAGSQAFRQAGFEAYSMAGGLEQWEQEGRPVQTGGA